MATPTNAPKTEKTPTADKPAPKTRLEGLNVRALYLKRLAEGFRDEVSGLASAEGTASKAGAVLAQMMVTLGTVCGEISDVPKKLFRLNELKWTPPAGRSSAFAAGALVTLKPNRLVRFTKNGAYDAKALASLTVASVHGDQAKIQITGTKEALGLVPTFWLVKSAA